MWGTSFKIVFLVLTIVCTMYVLESLYISTSSQVFFSDCNIFGGFAMTPSHIKAAADHLNLPYGSHVPLPHCLPFMFQSSLEVCAEKLPCSHGIGFSLGCISAVLAATEEVTLIAPVIDIQYCLRQRARSMHQYAQFLYFVLTMRNTTHNIISRMHPDIKKVTIMCGSHDTTSSPEYALQLARHIKRIRRAHVSLIVWRGTHNFNRWSNPEVVSDI